MYKKKIFWINKNCINEIKIDFYLFIIFALVDRKEKKKIRKIFMTENWFAIRITENIEDSC